MPTICFFLHGWTRLYKTLVVNKAEIFLMNKKQQEKLTSEWFKLLTHCGSSLKNFEYFNQAPDLESAELLLLDSFNAIVESFIEDDSDKRIDTVLSKLESFSLGNFAGYIQSVKHHSSYGHKLYSKEWALCYLLLGQLKLIKKKNPEVVKLICDLSFKNPGILKDYKFFVFSKPAQAQSPSQTLKIDYDAYSESSKALQRTKEKIKNNTQSQKRYKVYLKAQKLCNEIIERFHDSNDKKTFREKGMVISGKLDELKLIKNVSALIQDRIGCSLILEEENGEHKEIINYIPPQSSGASSKKLDMTCRTEDEVKKRTQALFQRIVKEFTEIEDKTKILENGLVVVARPDDYPLLLTIKDEICQTIKCDVYIREKKYESKEKLDGDTLVSIKF